MSTFFLRDQAVLITGANRRGIISRTIPSVASNAEASSTTSQAWERSRLSVHHGLLEGLQFQAGRKHTLVHHTFIIYKEQSISKIHSTLDDRKETKKERSSDIVRLDDTIDTMDTALP